MQNSNVEIEEEIDLIELLVKLWDGRKTIIKSTVVCFLIGIFMVLFSPKIYTAKSVLALQESSSSMGNLGGLASLAGINLGMASSGKDLSPKLYPKIVESFIFKKKLSNSALDYKGKDGKRKKITYVDYYEKGYAPSNVIGTIKKYTIGLPGLIIGSLSSSKNEKTQEGGAQNEPVYRLSKKEQAYLEKIKGQLSVELNDKEGLIDISYSMEDPYLAAQMAQIAQQDLQETIIDYKVKKAKDKLDFIEKRFEEAKQDFKTKQVRLASFVDGNRGLISSLPQTRQEQLQSEFNIAFGVYSELAKQLEAQKIQVKEETPVFTVIEPVTVPTTKSKPRTLVVIAVWVVLGVFIGVAIVFGRDFISDLKRKEKVSV